MRAHSLRGDTRQPCRGGDSIDVLGDHAALLESIDISGADCRGCSSAVRDAGREERERVLVARVRRDGRSCCALRIIGAGLPWSRSEKRARVERLVREISELLVPALN